MLELDEGREERVDEERDILDDERLVPYVCLAPEDDEELGPIGLLRPTDVAPTVGRLYVGVERWLRVAPTPGVAVLRPVGLALPAPNNPPPLEDRGLTRLGVRVDELELTGLGVLRRTFDGIPDPIRLLRLDEVAPTVGRR